MCKKRNHKNTRRNFRWLLWCGVGGNFSKPDAQGRNRGNSQPSVNWVIDKLTKIFALHMTDLYVNIYKEPLQSNKEKFNTPVEKAVYFQRCLLSRQFCCRHLELKRTHRPPWFPSSPQFPLACLPHLRQTWSAFIPETESPSWLLPSPLSNPY